MAALQKKVRESGIDLTFSHAFSVYSEVVHPRAWMIENLTAPFIFEELPEQDNAIDYRSSRFVVIPPVDLVFLEFDSEKAVLTEEEVKAMKGNLEVLGQRVGQLHPLHWRGDLAWAIRKQVRFLVMTNCFVCDRRAPKDLEKTVAAVADMAARLNKAGHSHSLNNCVVTIISSGPQFSKR